MSIHNGILLLDKPTGVTSHDLVRQLRKTLKMSAVGHCGTLDPMASGLMVMLLGEATKLSKYILEQNKTYHLKARFGLTTDTMDITGEVLSQYEGLDFDYDRIAKTASELQGDLALPVPIYSAVKVQGKKLYEYARQEDSVEVPIRNMSFFGLKPLGIAGNEGEWEISCSKGGYIRAWVHALGERLGYGATLSGLRRLSSFPFSIDRAITLDQLKELDNIEASPAFLPMSLALPHLKSVHVAGKDMKLLKNGQISHKLKSELITRYRPGSEVPLIKVLNQDDGQILALVGLEREKGFVIRRVFNH